MTWEELVELLGQGEGQSLEFEKTVPAAEDIARDIVAFANADGGKIIYGIDDKNQHLIGIFEGDDLLQEIKKIGTERCIPKIVPQVDTFERAGKKIIIVTVVEGEEKPYRTDDIAYIRDGIDTRPAKEEEEKQITNPWAGFGLNRRQLRALKMISEHGNITNREYREAFNVSHKTAHIELTMMADKKLVLSQGSGRSTCYILPSRD